MKTLKEEINRIKTMMGILIKEDKMSSIDLDKKKKEYENSGNLEWLEILEKFPETLQREIIDERPKGDEESIKELKNWRLVDKEPIKVPLVDLLDNKENAFAITRTPVEVMKKIQNNPKYKDKVSHLTHISNNDDYKGYGLKPGEIFDPNPDRYFKYAKFSGETAKPSTMVNGIIHWGQGRFIAALLRGDDYLNVWNIKE
jgi:hypothetical protein